MRDCTVEEVHFQTEHLGWHTDDFLIVGENSLGRRRKLIGQVKRTFTVSASNGECAKAILDFWQDFHNTHLFAPATDRLVLVTLRGTNTLLESFGGLLEAARSAHDGNEFERRLNVSGLINSKAAHYCDEIREIIKPTPDESISRAGVWAFLRVLHVLSLDLNTSTSQTEAAIKTMFALSAAEESEPGAATTTWNELLAVVGDAMPNARRYHRDDLPEAVRLRQSPVRGRAERILNTLTQHSSFIMHDIHTTIGDTLHLDRGPLVQEIRDRLERIPVVLISGAAGSGKSAVAKDVLTELAPDHFVFSFRAEEFARAHIDQVLQSSQIPATAQDLGAILAAQERKILLVESTERLLEKSTRDAFSDLLRLLEADPSWRLVLTCRDYSSDLIRAAFLQGANLESYVITVPALDDAELSEVERGCPELARPLSHPALRPILRNPYLLNQALQIDWTADRPLPESEAEFRARFWQEMVRADHHTIGGMARRRESALVEVALRRARSLRLYANCGDIDPEAIAALQHDSLLVGSPEGTTQLAVAHDVLEDWAILHWLDEQDISEDEAIRQLPTVIEPYPAIRRTYRKWAGELLERDKEAANRLFGAIIAGMVLPTRFRDDTLVALLRSPIAVAFLERHEAQIFANDKQLLRRIVHLLRVACVTTPAWLPRQTAGSVFNVPEGLAWSCVLQLVQSNLRLFTSADHALLLGFIEDWARGVSVQTPYPAGAEAAAAIAHALLPHLDNVRRDSPRKRALRVIAQIPNADPDRFVGLLAQRSGEAGRNRKADAFLEIIFEKFNGVPAARDMPEALVSAVREYLLLSESDLQAYQDHYMASDEVETIFGITRGTHFDFFPASANKGPFLPLLRYHPRQGLDFIIEVINRSTNWYARPRIGSGYLEPPFEITMTFSVGASTVQWCNARLWNLYRGTSVGPYVLQSLLMALERFLLEYAETQPGDIDACLLYILRSSSSAALTAVVASIATAFPRLAPETLLALLQTPPCVLLDGTRLAYEMRDSPGMINALAEDDKRYRIYTREREAANSLPHRQCDLEWAVLQLQAGPMASRVQAVLDRHRAELPPAETQDEADQVWRLAIHRMDLRQYKITEIPGQAPRDAEGPPTTEDNSRRFRLDLEVPDPDLNEIIAASAAQSARQGRRGQLLIWGHRVFKREETANFDPALWQQYLDTARALRGGGAVEEENDVYQGGPGFVATIGVRDHWEAMARDERDWCVDVVCSEVEQRANNWGRLVRVQRYDLSPDRACAWVVPLLIGKPLTEMQQQRVRRALVSALTHPIEEVRDYAALGVGDNLWSIDRDLTLRCVNALALEATQVQEEINAQGPSPYLPPEQYEETVASAAANVRAAFWGSGGIADNAYQAVDLTTWTGARANTLILNILKQAPAEDVAIVAFERLARTLAVWWDADNDPQSDWQAPNRDHVTESALSYLLEGFLVRTSTGAAALIVHALSDAVDQHPSEVGMILEGILSFEDPQHDRLRLWSLWKLFADRVKQARWLPWIDHEHSTGQGMISALFFGLHWTEGTHQWWSLDGFTSQVDQLFEELPTSSTILYWYLQFLYHVGEQSLPGAFICIARRLEQADSQQMLKQANSVYLLEVLLQRYVYGRPLELKRQADLRAAVLFLLEVLIENGSSAAFRMRDDFVTPIPSL